MMTAAEPEANPVSALNLTTDVASNVGNEMIGSSEIERQKSGGQIATGN
jgi:hypothetical protein